MQGGQQYDSGGEGEHNVEGGGMGGGMGGSMGGSMGGGEMVQGGEQGGFADNHQEFQQGAYGRDQVENNGEGQEQEGGESQENQGQYLKEGSKKFENSKENQKDTSEKRKQISRPASKTAKSLVESNEKKVSKRQVMPGYQQGLSGYPAYMPSYSPFYREKKHHKTRVDVDVIGKRSTQEQQDQNYHNENHFLF